jgi:hypothetical protein
MAAFADEYILERGHRRTKTARTRSNWSGAGPLNAAELDALLGWFTVPPLALNFAR